MIRSLPESKRLAAAFQPLIGTVQDWTNRLKRLARNRGWPYLIAWAHRLTGVLLVVYVGFHIWTLSALHQPEQFSDQMRRYGFSLFVFLEWMLAIPVIFHALNGGRLILYEIFGNRRDDFFIQWAAGLSAGYVLLLALVMIIGNQVVSAVFFWIYSTAAAGCITGITVFKMRSSRAAIFWKLQRITGAYLLLMVPAHMLFMHLNPSLGHDGQVIMERMNTSFIRLVDLTLLLCVLYHGAYGLFAIGQDYLMAGWIRIACGGLIAAAMTVLASIGLKLLIAG
jgi:succinate dehydrogenase hydrophobic anchor subunit